MAVALWTCDGRPQVDCAMEQKRCEELLRTEFLSRGELLLQGDFSESGLLSEEGICSKGNVRGKGMELSGACSTALFRAGGGAAFS